jgi:hypothetical protein
MKAYRSVATRGRASLVFGAVFFGAAQLALALAMENGLPELRDREFSLRLARLRARLAQAPGRPLVLVIGSSRTGVGFRPEALPARLKPAGPVVFNFSMVAAGPVGELLTLHRLLAAGVRPAWVFVEFWPPLWCAEGGLKEETHLLRARRLSWGDLRFLGKYFIRPERHTLAWCLDRLLPCVSHRSLVLRSYAPSWLPRTRAAREADSWLASDGSGWLTHFRVCEQDPGIRPRPQAVERELRDWARDIGRLRLAEASDRAMRRFLATCRKKGIAVGVVYLPEGKVFRRMYPDAVLAEVGHRLRRLGRQWHVPVIDARTWVSDDSFWESYHLLPWGATAFTRRFGREVLGRLLAGESIPPQSQGFQQVIKPGEPPRVPGAVVNGHDRNRQKSVSQPAPPPVLRQAVRHRQQGQQPERR